MADRAKLRSTNQIVIPLVRDVLLQRADGPQDRRSDVIHPSEMAKADWCPRATYYRISGRPDPASDFSLTLQNIFAEGNFIHAKWQDWLADTGKLWGDWHCTVCQTTMRKTLRHTADALPCLLARTHKWRYQEVALHNDELNIRGFEDGALVGPNVLVELKSVGIGTLRFEAPDLLARHYDKRIRQYDLEGLWKSIVRPFPSHVRQVNVYMWLAKHMGLPFDKTAVVYEFKVNQQVKEFLVPFSQDIVDPLLERAREIVHAFKYGQPPACPQSGCKYCKPYEDNLAALQAESERPYRGDRAPAGAVLSGRRRHVRARRDERPEPVQGDGADTQAVEADQKGA